MKSTSLREQLMRAAMLTTSVAILLSAGALLLYELISYRQTWVTDLRTQARLLAAASVAAMEFDDAKAAHENLRLLKSQPNIRSATLYDARGTLFAAYAEPGVAVEARREEAAASLLPRFHGTTLEIAFPVDARGERLGILYLSARHDIWSRLLGFGTILLVLGILSMAAAFLLFARLQRRITVPLERMTQVAGDVVASHNWSLRAPATHYRDLGVLVDAFNGLLSECEARTRDLEQEMESRRGIELDLRREDEKKDTFLATLAHELRNPLAPMTSAVALLQMTKASPETRSKALVVLDRQIKLMVRLVNDLLDASRITTGKLALDVEPVELGELVGHAVDGAQSMAEECGVTLTLRPCTEEVWSAGDAVRLTQVFSNLLNNACRYTPAGGGVYVSIVGDAQWVVVAVRDTGIGVARHMQSRIFELFEQADTSQGRGRAGLGVGLTLCRQIVELHQGSIELSSAGPGCGSCFSVRLPRLQSDDLATDAAPSVNARHLRRLRILIADDNVDLAENFAELLRASGHEVEVVHDGDAALQRARLTLPDIALLDIGMPKRDGYEVARQLKSMVPTDKIHLVAISGWGQPSDKENAIQAGFDRHLVKPVQAQELVRILVDAFEEFAASRPGELM